jgi:hypothetical protein
MAGIVCPDLTIAYLYTSIRIKIKILVILVIKYKKSSVDYW